jgi:hypothetical protein
MEGNNLSGGGAPKKPSRPVHLYDLPVGCGAAEVGLVELTAGEEKQSGRRGGNDAACVAMELTKAALAEVDGVKVGLTDGTADIAWDKLGPKGRSLVMDAFNHLSSPSKEEADSFQASHRVRVA